MAKLYPISKSSDLNAEAYTRLGTDYIFVCTINEIVQAIGQHGGRVYTYVFMQQGVFPPLGFCKTHVCHSSDLLYTWRQPAFFPMNDQQNLLSDKWIGYYTNFATTGDPSQGPTESVTLEDSGIHSEISLPYWPAYTHDQPLYQFLDTVVSTNRSARISYCDAWVSLSDVEFYSE